jgi:hypothetical protein
MEEFNWAVDAINRARVTFPKLGPFGIRGCTPDQDGGGFTSDYIEQVAHARRWLTHLKPNTTAGTGKSSYGLKHDAEGFQGRYICNGSMIAAALAMGFPCAELNYGPNCRVGVNKVSLRSLQRRREQIRLGYA